jgi:hypothetical protein
MAEGSDKKLDNIKKAIASSKAKKKSKKTSSKGDQSYEMGPRRSSGIPVNLDDPVGNVRNFGREFTAPKGRKATSFSMGRKRGK